VKLGLDRDEIGQRAASRAQPREERVEHLAAEPRERKVAQQWPDVPHGTFDALQGW